MRNILVRRLMVHQSSASMIIGESNTLDVLKELNDQNPSDVKALDDHGLRRTPKDKVLHRPLTTAVHLARQVRGILADPAHARGSVVPTSGPFAFLEVVRVPEEKQ